jgi:hypothetical protein
MSLQPIPIVWRQAVSQAIRAGRSNFTQLGRRKWESSFPGGFKAELEDDLVSFLKNNDALGCPVPMDYPPAPRGSSGFAIRAPEPTASFCWRTAPGAC